MAFKKLPNFDWRFIVIVIGAIFVVAVEEGFIDLGGNKQENLPEQEKVKETVKNKPGLEQLSDKLLAAIDVKKAHIPNTDIKIGSVDDKGVLPVNIHFETRSGSSFADSEIELIKTWLTGLTCVETPQYFDHGVGSLVYQLNDKESRQFASFEVRDQACRSFRKDMFEGRMQRRAKEAALSIFRTNPQEAVRLYKEKVATLPDPEEEPGIQFIKREIEPDGTVYFEIKHTDKLATDYSDEDFKRMANGALNVSCMDPEFRDFLDHGFPAVKLTHIDKADKQFFTISTTLQDCKRGEPNLK